jgi:two-component system chemotaxis response regulator CheY
MNINIKYFYEDAYRHLQVLEDIVGDIKKGTNNKEKISELFRSIHTIKGSADIVGLKDIVSVSHKAEDLLALIRDEKIAYTSSIGELFIEIKDSITYLVNHAEKEINSKMKTIVANLEDKITKSIKKSKKSSKKKEKKKKTILVVDDASMIRNLATKTAQEAGYEVVLAEDGHDGLEKLKENNIDLIFSDINMPQMGGLEMVEKIRNIKKYEFLPIVMLTTEKKDDLKKKGKALGVKAWLVKPFNKNKLLIVLEKLLG